MSFVFNLPPNAEILIDGVPHAFQQVIDGRLAFLGKHGTHLIPDPVNGGFMLPDELWFADGLREGRIEVLAPKASTAIRQIARAQQYSPDEILAMDPQVARDHFVCTEIDVRGTKHGNKAIGLLIAELWSSEDVRKKYGEVPPKAATIRHHLKHRGVRDDRRWADFRKMTGLMGAPCRDAVVRTEIMNTALQYYKRRGYKITDVHAEVADNIGKLNESRAADQQLTVPCYQTVRRAVRALERRSTMTAKHGARFVKSVYEGAGLPLVAHAILEIAMFDHTPVPTVFCVDAEHGVVAGQPHLAIMIDLYSRCILYAELTFRDPTQGSIGRALLGANTPKLVPAHYANRYPTMVMVCGRPVTTYFDNALYQIARGVEDAFADSGAGVYYVGVDEPTHKAVVERVLQTFQELLFKKLPGSTFDIPGMRQAGYNPSEHAVMTIAQARALLAEAIALYHITPHAELNGRQPLLVWEKSAKKDGINLITDVRQLKAAIGTAVYDCVLAKDGIELNGLRYADRRIIGELLDDLVCLEPRRRRTKSPTAKVKVKFDDLDLGSIEVWNNRTKTYVTLPCDDPEYACGMPLWLHEKIHEAAKNEALGFNTPAERLAARHRLNLMIDELAPEIREREARMLAKLHEDPKLRQLMTGNVLVQVVEPSPTGMESVVPQTMASNRDDSLQPAPRPVRRPSTTVDTRDAAPARKAKPSTTTAARPRDRRSAGKPTKGEATTPVVRKRSALTW